MLHDPVRYTIRDRCITNCQAPYGFLNVIGVGYLGLACGNKGVGLQHHVGYLNNGQIQWYGDRLELGLQTVSQGLRLSPSSRQQRPPV